jgi:hypothetical protein
LCATPAASPATIMSYYKFAPAFKTPPGVGGSYVAAVWVRSVSPAKENIALSVTLGGSELAKVSKPLVAAAWTCLSVAFQSPATAPTIYVGQNGDATGESCFEVVEFRVFSNAEPALDPCDCPAPN